MPMIQALVGSCYDEIWTIPFYNSVLCGEKLNSLNQKQSENKTIMSKINFITGLKETR